MNRRSFFALLPALPLIAAVNAQPSRRVHIHGRSRPYDAAQLAEQLKGLAKAHAKEFVDPELSPEVAMATYKEALSYGFSSL